MFCTFISRQLYYYYVEYRQPIFNYRHSTRRLVCTQADRWQALDSLPHTSRLLLHCQSNRYHIGVV